MFTITFKDFVIINLALILVAISLLCYHYFAQIQKMEDCVFEKSFSVMTAEEAEKDRDRIFDCF